MPAPLPAIPAQRTAPVWEFDQLFRQPDYPDGWALEDEDDDQEP